jgi:hypothetical protein
MHQTKVTEIYTEFWCGTFQEGGCLERKTENIKMDIKEISSGITVGLNWLSVDYVKSSGCQHSNAWSRLFRQKPMQFEVLTAVKM